MRIMALLLIASTCAAQTSVIASRHYKEPTAVQMTFGSFTKPTSIYNNASAYTAVPDAQIEPSNLTLSTNTFGSSTGLNTYKPSFATGTGSLGVASNTATLTLSGNQGILVTDTSAAYTIPFTNIFVACTVSQNGTAGAGTADSAGCGIAKDGSNYIVAHYNKPNGHWCITIAIAGTTNDLACTSNGTFSVPTAPWIMGFSLVNNQATAWWQQNGGTTWKMLTTTSVSAQNDFTGTSGLSSWFYCFEADLASSSSTWKFTQLKGGGFGGVGIRDLAVITYTDGRPYMVGSVAYLMATAAGVSGGVSDTPTLILSYDVSSTALTVISSIGLTKSTHIYNEAGGSIIYDPITGTERVMISDWAAGASSAISYYASQSVATDNWLSSGFHKTPAATGMTMPTSASNNWDPNLACTSYNYSANTCSKWQVSYAGPTGSSHPQIATSTSDPSSNSWTGVLNDTGFSTSEGANIIRSATGSAGVAYTSCWTQVSNTSKCYNQAGSSQGALNVTFPASTSNPSHANIFCYASTCYLVTFDSNAFSTLGQSMGNFNVATAPRHN